MQGMTIRRGAYLLALLVGAAGSACELVAGIQDLHETADAGVGPSDGGADGDATVSPGDASGDASADASGDVRAETAPPEAGPDGCGSVEICTDGIDNDCNGLVDCADPACSPGFACVPIWPSGFTAPVALFDGFADGGPAPVPPPCVSPYFIDSMDEYDTPVLGPISCSCSCDIGCSAPTVAAYTGSACTGPAGQATPVPAGTGGTAGPCTQIASEGGIDSCGVVSAGGNPSCRPHQNYSLPQWDPAARAAWAGAGRACTPDTVHKYFAGDAGGCPAGNYCAEAPASTFGGGHVCLLSAGQVTCPSAYPNAHTYYNSGADNAHCTGDCTCSAAGALGCSLAVDCFTGAGTCTGTDYPVPAGGAGACAPVGSGVNAVSATVTATTSGTCTPAGTYAWNGQGVTASGGETTVCCK